jgi:RNA polymerase sigma factor (sigma-70 family)
VVVQKVARDSARRRHYLIETTLSFSNTVGMVMRKESLGNVLRDLRTIFAGQRYGEMPDTELLECFNTQRDEAAFAAILARHGPMVLGVCRRILRNQHDAEDACQATFLVLARTAATIRKRESLGSWLHGVACHVARKSLADARRRSARDVTEADASHPDPQTELTWREGLIILDEELARLPASYRLALVLCYLEGRPQELVARDLACSPGALRGRLERARECLRKRLVRRGVGLPAGAITGVLLSTSAQAALPSMFSVVTSKAVAKLHAGQSLSRVVSASVASLAEGVLTTMGVIRATTVAGCLLSVSLLAAFGSALTVAAPDEERAAASGERSRPALAALEKTEQAPSANKDGERVTVHGRVLDPDGQPVAGAKLYVGVHSSLKKREYPVRATSGADGRFDFSIPRSDLNTTGEDHPAFQVLAVAEGYGCAWGASNMAAKDDVTLRLVTDAPVKGRILDAEGQPVAGAKLTVTSVSRSQGGVGGALGWEGPLPGQADVLTTGADGRFQVAGVGGGRFIHFRLEGRAIATATFDAQGTAFEYQAALSRPIRGLVRDKDTGNPLAGASVTSGLCEALTDKEGRYELLGVPKSANYGVYLESPKGRHYFGRRATVADTPGAEALTADFEMEQATVLVHGKVTDKGTGRPVAGARIEYWPLYGNNTAAKMEAGSVPTGKTITGAEGTYDLPVMPGPGVMLVTGPRPNAYMAGWVTLEERKAFFQTPLIMPGSPDPDGSFEVSTGGGGPVGGVAQRGHHAVVLLEPGEKEEALVRDVTLVRPRERKGRVVGPDGKPLVGVMVAGVDPSGAVKGDEFIARDFNPKAPAPLLTFYHKDKNLGAFLRGLPPETDGPLVVKLQPCGSLSGRIVDHDGQPVVGFRGGFSPGKEFSTDKEGRFRVEGLVPGLEYNFFWMKKSQGQVVQAMKRDGPNAVVAPGMNKDFGDIRMFKGFDKRVNF